MTEKKTLQDEELENVTGGSGDNTFDGAIIFSVPPNYYSTNDYVCSNVSHNGLTSGKNGGITCQHCNKLSASLYEDGKFKPYCYNVASDFRVLN